MLIGRKQTAETQIRSTVKSAKQLLHIEIVSLTNITAANAAQNFLKKKTTLPIDAETNEAGVLERIKSGKLPLYALEKTLGDLTQAVRVRRLAYWFFYCRKWR